MWALIFAAPFWAAVACGAKAAAAQRPITDAPAFLAKRGLTATPVPVVVVPFVGDDTTYGTGADGAAYPDRIEIANDQR